MTRHSGWGRLCQAAIVGGALLLAGCIAPQAQPITLTATPGPALAMILPDAPDLPAGANPLTGLVVDDPATLQRRPLAVKISNAPDSVRPQAGIGAADLVFEHYVEGRLTRLTAVFWSQTPPRVGSIRSARLIDLDIPAMYGALFAYSGASEPIRQRIAAQPFAPRAYEGVTTGEPLYYRDSGIEMPHNMFITPIQVWARAAADGVNDPPDLRGLAFSTDLRQAGIAATALTINYGPDVVRWDYDPATGQYARRVDDLPHTDANTGVQITAANVVLIYAEHQDDLDIVESEWQGVKSYSIDIRLWDSGPATLFRDGQMVQGVWSRQDRDDMLTFWASSDRTQPLIFKPGNTWFQVVPPGFTGVLVE